MDNYRENDNIQMMRKGSRGREMTKINELIRVQEQHPQTPRNEMRTYRSDSFCRSEGLLPIERITTAVAERLEEDWNIARKNRKDKWFWLRDGDLNVVSTVGQGRNCPWRRGGPRKGPVSRKHCERDRGNAWINHLSLVAIA
jgi:hypothetical protein